MDYAPSLPSPYPLPLIILSTAFYLALALPRASLAGSLGQAGSPGAAAFSISVPPPVTQGYLLTVLAVLAEEFVSTKPPGILMP